MIRSILCADTVGVCYKSLTRTSELVFLGMLRVVDWNRHFLSLSGQCPPPPFCSAGKYSEDGYDGGMFSCFQCSAGKYSAEEGMWRITYYFWVMSHWGAWKHDVCGAYTE